MLNFFGHINELKLRIFYFFISFSFTFLSSYFFILELIYLIVNPFLSFVKTEDSDFIFTNVFEILNLYITLSFSISFFFSIFILLYFIFLYLKTGLFKYEKKLFLFFFKFSFFFSLLSLVFLFFIFFPSFLSFLLSLSLILDAKFFVLKMNLRLYEYLTLVSQFCVIYSLIIFQLPLLIFFYAYVNIKDFKIKFFYVKRRFWFFFSSILSLLFSSPELYSFFLTFIPLVLAFEAIIFLLIIKKSYQFSNKESCLNGKRQVC